MKSSTQSFGTQLRSDSRRIADALRNQILKDELVAGTRLPTTRELTATWKASSGTIHNALKALAKEGLIKQHHGSGTYVADRKSRFRRVGIYHSFDLKANEETHATYFRLLQSALLRQLANLHKDVQIITDRRPYEKKGVILPALKEANMHRHVHSIIAPLPRDIEVPVLARLRVPTAFSHNPESPNRVDFIADNFFLEALQHLTRQGCRSVGLITNAREGPYGSDAFFHAVRDAGMVTCHQWIRSPEQSKSELGALGYHAFCRLWKLAKRPEGLIVYPDEVVSGAITAILNAGRPSVTRQMKFVFHRNAYLGFLCPFPVTWAISDENILAKGLIQQIQKQFDGEKVFPILLPYQFRDNEPWLIEP